MKRLVPDYISEKMMLQNKIDVNGDGHCFPCMGCRSFLTPYLDENRKPKYYGRFNQGVVTINLPDVGLSAVKKMEGITYVNDEQYQKRKEEIFWEIFEERLSCAIEHCVFATKDCSEHCRMLLQSIGRMVDLQD